MRIPMTLVLVLAMTVAPGCCTVLHGDRTSRPQSQRGDFDFGCAVVGNFVLGGVIGIVVDLANGAAQSQPSPYLKAMSIDTNGLRAIPAISNLY